MKKLNKLLNMITEIEESLTRIVDNADLERIFDESALESLLKAAEVSSKGAELTARNKRVWVVTASTAKDLFLAYKDDLSVILRISKELIREVASELEMVA